MLAINSEKDRTRGGRGRGRKRILFFTLRGQENLLEKNNWTGEKVNIH